MPRGRADVTLMAGTEWEARGTIFHSGARGPRFMVLGGVHGNEPGGWLAAESMAEWGVDRGMLIVLPRVNWRAAAAFERTIDGAGDLNRMYPGDPEGIPMAQMAWEITRLAQQWQVHWLWDMHESWGFFNERGANSGTAFIGQTLTIADPAREAEVARVLSAVNAQVAEREQMVMRVRAGGMFRNDGLLPTGRGRSSLSIGNEVHGVSAVLVEMGQMNQAESRRSELHQLVARTMLEELGAL